MVDCKARQREEERRQRKKSDSFAEVLQETRKELQMKDGITYQAAGYTKDAIAYNYTVKKREYV